MTAPDRERLDQITAMVMALDRQSPGFARGLALTLIARVGPAEALDIIRRAPPPRSADGIDVNTLIA